MLMQLISGLASRLTYRTLKACRVTALDRCCAIILLTSECSDGVQGFGVNEHTRPLTFITHSHPLPLQALLLQHSRKTTGKQH